MKTSSISGRERGSVTLKVGCVTLIALSLMGSSPPVAYADQAPLLADADLHARYFETPSGNIVCMVQRRDNLLRCDIRSGLNPEPKKRCEGDWVGLLLGRMNRARPNCASDGIASNDPRPVLGYGEKWRLRGRTCISKRSGLYCRNDSGYHFKLSRDGWGCWYRP